MLNPTQDDLARFVPLHELDGRFQASEYRIKWAEDAWERDRAHRLRRDVFCTEQRVFETSDLDDVDRRAQLIVALACMAGVADDVVGTVRIHEAEPGTWWGSRLAVAADHRAQGRLGATLIRLAVRSAHARGCRLFLAHVQEQNVPLFRRLHWHGLEPLQLHGRPHWLMRADLAHYPPCHTPYAGLATHAAARRAA